MGMVHFSLAGDVAKMLELPFGYTVQQNIDDENLANVPHFWDCVAYRNSSGWHRCKKYLPVSLDIIKKLVAEDNDAFLNSEDWLFVELENPEASFLRLAMLDDNVIFADENDCVELEFMLFVDKNPTYLSAIVHTEHRSSRDLLEMLQDDDFWRDENGVWQFFSNAVLRGARVERTYSVSSLGSSHYSHNIIVKNHHASHFFPFASGKKDRAPYKDSKTGLWRVDLTKEKSFSFQEFHEAVQVVQIVGNGMEDEA